MLKKILFILVLCFSLNVYAEISQSDFDKASITALGTPEERQDFVNFVLKNNDRANSLSLLIAARNALESGRIQDSGFLYFAALLRTKLDIFTYPSGASNAQQAIAPSIRALSPVIQPAIMQDPNNYVEILNRIKAWQVIPRGEYYPSWLSKKEKSTEEIKNKADELKSSLVAEMSNFSMLIHIPEYHKAVIDIRIYNIIPKEKNPISEDDYNAAVKIIKRIESEKKVSVMSKYL